MRKIVSLFFLLLLRMGLAFSQDSFFNNYVYENWNSFGGLTGTTATDIVQTSDGFINIGTYEGLVRFDGMEFHARRYVSLTHSSASEALAKMLQEIFLQYFPYFASVSVMACSDRDQ